MTVSQYDLVVPYTDLGDRGYFGVDAALVNCLVDSTDNASFSLSGEPDYFGRNEISSGGDLSHYSSASLY